MVALAAIIGVESRLKTPSRLEISLSFHPSSLYKVVKTFLSGSPLYIFCRKANVSNPSCCKATMSEKIKLWNYLICLLTHLPTRLVFSQFYRIPVEEGREKDENGKSRKIISPNFSSPLAIEFPTDPKINC